MSSKILEFVPISSSIDPSFWNKLSEIKLNDDKLDEKEHPVWGYFSNINNKCKFPILEVNSTSFNSQFDSQKIYIPFHGEILNVNTIEVFKDFDKTECINRIGKNIFESIQNGKALETPSLLNRFYILSYADLKKFHFYYWFAFPVPYNLSIKYNSVKNIYDDFTKDQLEFIWEKYCEMENSQKPYFLVSLENTSVNVLTMKQLEFLDEGNVHKFYFAFYDLSLLENCPGSMLRNYVTLILHHCPALQGKSLNFLSLRIRRNEDYKLMISDSLIFNLDLPVFQSSVSDFINQDPEKRWVGWEKNERGKLGPRLSNMKSFLDPKELAESSVDLNLKLMKWRLLSNIDLEKIKTTKFLLLGAGTLGCSVARILLGWGARNISFIDNSIVSYSNPVRQSLFTFEDSQNSKPKSVAAAENLRKIFPGVKSTSHQMTIPMPGHPVGESMLEELKKNTELLASLISKHDVIFLLMDSRESRWLPTLLGAYYSKIVINAALGFDSYLVMRHGVRVDTEEFKVRQHESGFKSLKGNFLGCYFCNDVTAPGNSMKDRTLDQQCTVTRPGVSAIAGALAAELAISLLQHKEGAKAAAFYHLGNIENSEQELNYQCVLGIIPHSIRGYLSTFSQVLPAVERYQQCIACSEAVLDKYRKDSFSFLLEVFQNSKYLEDVTGLAHMNKEAEDTKIWEFSDEEEVLCTDYEDETDSDAASKASPEQQKGVKKAEADSMEPEEGAESSDYFEEKQTPKQYSSRNLHETKSINEIIEGVLEDLIKNAEKSNEEEKLTDEKSEASNSSTEFFNKILPDDILKIVRKLQIPSHSQDILPDSLNFEELFQSNLLCLNNDCSKQNLSGSSLNLSSNLNVEEKTVSTVKSSRYPSGISVYTSGVPKELLPVLEKQGSRRNLFYGSTTSASLKKSQTGQKITEILKPRTIDYSFSNIDNKGETEKDILHLKNENLTLISDPRELVSSDSTFDEFSPSESNAAMKKLRDSGLTKSNVQDSDPKSRSASLLTLKSLIKNFASSGSSQNLSFISSASAKSKSKTSISNKLKRVFSPKTFKRSSDSFSVNDFLREGENKGDEIITIAKPQEIFSSGSLTSENLGGDDSVYYLAETDSDKTFVND